MAMPGTGVTIAVGDGGSPETFTNIATVEGVSGAGGLSRPTVAVPDIAKEFATFIDGGKVTPAAVSLSLSWDPSETTHTTLRALLDTGAATNFRITFTDTGAEVLDFAAFLTEYSGVEVSDGERATGSITLQPNKADGTNPLSYS